MRRPVNATDVTSGQSAPNPRRATRAHSLRVLFAEFAGESSSCGCRVDITHWLLFLLQVKGRSRGVHDLSVSGLSGVLISRARPKH